jgi:hypothetical protein
MNLYVRFPEELICIIYCKCETVNHYCTKKGGEPTNVISPSTSELNPSAQRCLTRFFTGDFAF